MQSNDLALKKTVVIIHIRLDRPHIFRVSTDLIFKFVDVHVRKDIIDSLIDINDTSYLRGLYIVTGELKKKKKKVICINKIRVDIKNFMLPVEAFFLNKIIII